MKIQNSTRSFYGRFLTAIGLMLMTAVTVVRAGYQSTVLGDNPLVYYALTSDVTNGTATDLTTNAVNGNSYNLTDAGSGPSAYITNAAAFDGVSASIDVAGAPALLNSNGPITLEAWVQAAPLINTGLGNIIAKGYVNGNEMTLRDNNLNYYGYFGGPGVGGGTQTTDWTYLVLSSDGTNITLYVNGVAVQQTADTFGAHNFVDDWSIGTGSPDGQYSTNHRYFHGSMSQVAIYGHGLTAGQVLTHYYLGEINAYPSNSAPIINPQPQPTATYIGGQAKFSVTAASAFATTNQWLKNGVPISGKTNATLTLKNVQVGDIANYSVIVGNINGTTTSAAAALSVLTIGNSLQWSANTNTGVWDTTNSPNWINLANSQQTNFNTTDQVLFDDTVGVPTSVNVSANVSPSIITVNSSINNFTIGTGTTRITGPGSLVKQGSSKLTIYDSGNLTGPVNISGGSVTAGNNAFRSAASITITNNATLNLAGGVLGGNKPITVSGTGVNGQGAIINDYNDYPGQSMNVTLTGDTLFGYPARWDMGGGSQVSGPHYLTLDSSADFSGANSGGDGNPYCEWSANVGADVLGITLTNGIGLALTNTAISKLGLHQMDNAFQNPGTVVTVAPNCIVYFWDGGYNGSFHVLNNGQVYLWTAPAAFNGSNVILEDNAQWLSWNGSGNEPINSAITLNGVAHIVVGDHNMIYTNLISGPGGFVWDAYNHQMVFSASNTYSGPTVIGGGGPTLALTGNGSISHSSLIFFGGSTPANVSLDVSGRSDTTLTLASGQTLGGIGTINGSLVVSAGATLSPSGTNTTIGITTGANATGTIAATNAVTLNGTTVIKLSGSGVNDQIQAGGGITFGGALQLVSIDPLRNNTYQIASAASYAGSFASITPATPGVGLAWDTSQLNTAGILKVVATTHTVIRSINVSGGNVIFSGTNGAPNAGYVVLTSTNVATPLANWVPLFTNAFDGTGAFGVTNAVNSNVPNQFYIIQQ
jgi:hypothetical protein